MAAVKQTFTLGARRQTSTPIQRARAGSLLQPRKGGTGAVIPPGARLSGRATPTNRANPTSPAGADPRNVPLLLSLERPGYGKGR